MALTDIGSVTGITRDEAPTLAAEEYRRFARLAADLSPDEWGQPTDCPEWTVREVLAHVAGSMAGTSFREGTRQRKLAQQRSQSSGRGFLDAMNEVQIEERAGRSPAEVAQEVRERTEPAVRARRRVPGLLRRAPIPGSDGQLTLGKLLDVILTRDVWMHRIDVCRATGRAPELTPGHDGRLVADVVREWSDLHGRPFTLRLTGPAGGGFRRDGDGPELDLDAVEFCRTLSGRGTGDGLLATRVVF